MLKHLLYKIIFIFTKGEDLMMAMLFATKIILGKATFGQVPRLLKQQVADILIENGCTELITEEEYLPSTDETVEEEQ